MQKFDHILVHFDIDVLDEHFFHSTYFANTELVGDGADVIGFTIAEYLPCESAYSKYMGDAIFKVPTPLMLDKIVTAVDGSYEQMAQLKAADTRARFWGSKGSFEPSEKHISFFGQRILFFCKKM